MDRLGYASYVKRKQLEETTRLNLNSKRMLLTGAFGLFLTSLTAGVGGLAAATKFAVLGKIASTLKLCSSASSLHDNFMKTQQNRFASNQGYYRALLDDLRNNTQNSNNAYRSLAQQSERSSRGISSILD